MNQGDLFKRLTGWDVPFRLPLSADGQYEEMLCYELNGIIIESGTGRRILLKNGVGTLLPDDHPNPK